ncbi:MAG: isochorismatase family protein [Gammaproteobacteria bacterium]|nr:isochorismatase family protein [Gammaproteobacteria bacterium]
MTESKQHNYAGVFDNRIGFGVRPALLCVDFVRAYTTEGSPLFAPQVIGAVRETVEVLKAARSAGIPVIHTNVCYTPGAFLDGGVWLKKLPALKMMVPGAPLAETCSEVRPAPGEPVLTKHYASAFFGTSLAALLTAAQVDTCILVGCSTSGCIRASAVDAVQHGFRAIVIRECVGDRHPDPHEANLFDIASKYGDVVGKDEALAYLAGLPRRV